MSETVRINSQEVQRNTRKWDTRTNRHTTTTGYSWGWIEGAPGNICWSDDSSFNHAAAYKVCQEHNKWLEEQKPIALRIVEAKAAMERLGKAYSTAEAAAEKAQAAWAEACKVLTDLKAAAKCE